MKFIKTLKRIFPNILIGYSDHVRSDENLTQIQVAYEMGAQIIEKHFTHNKKSKGNDHYHAMDSIGFENFLKLWKEKKFFLVLSRKN